MKALRYITDHMGRSVQLFQGLRFGVVILLSIMLTHSGLSLEEVGHYEQFVFAGGLLSFMWSMGLTKAALSYYPSLAEADKPSFFPALLRFTLIVGVATAASGWLLRGPIQSWLSLEGYPYWGYACLLSGLLTTSIAVEPYFILNGQARRNAHYAFFAFGSIFLWGCYAIWLCSSVELFIQGYVLWYVLRAAYSAWTCGISRPVTMALSGFLAYSVPLMMHVVLGNGMEYIDGIIVNHYFDDATFPLFRYGARELPLSTIFIAGIVSVLIPLYVQSQADTLRQIRAEALGLMRWLFPLSAGLILASPWLYHIVYGAEFEVSAMIFNIYLMVILSRILMPQIIIQAMHRNGVLVYAALGELVINVVLSLVFVQKWGLMGIAAATWVAYMANKVFLMAYVYWSMGIAPKAYVPARAYAGYGLMLSGAFGLAIWWLA